MFLFVLALCCAFFSLLRSAEMHFFLTKFTKIAPKRIQNFRQCSHFTHERLLSEENRENCLKCWRRKTHLALAMTTSTTTTTTRSKSNPIFAGNTNKSNNTSGSEDEMAGIDNASSADNNASKSNSNTNLLAAVLIPVCVNKEGEVSLLYTKRSGKLSRHVRQISFPGGLRDKKDASFEDCALRETEEEIGLKRKRIHVWGGTESLIQLPERPPIMPIIGVIKNFSLNELKLNKNEVEEAFTVPIKTLCSTDVMKHTQFRTDRGRGYGYSTPLFMIESKRIWGITALITKMFLECFLPKNVYKHKVGFIRPYKIK